MTDYIKFESWLDNLICDKNFSEVKAFNFNLYEEYTEDDAEIFTVQLIGSPLYEKDNPDWACNAIYSSCDNVYVVEDCSDWEKCIEKFNKIIREYLLKSQYAKVFQEKIALTFGFVDGDLEIVFDKTKDQDKTD